MHSFAVFANQCPDEDVMVLRELLAFDSLCPKSFPLVRYKGGFGALGQSIAHSPLHWSRQMEWPWVLRHGEFTGDHYVLDIGGGWSVLRYAVGRRCKWLTVVDVDPESVEVATACAKIVGANNITHALADAVALPYTDNSFDRTLCVSVLEHIPGKHLQCVREAVRVTRPGGVVLLTMDVVLQLEEDKIVEPDGDFHLDIKGAGDILNELQVPLTEGNAVGGGNFVGQPDLKLGVLMIRYVKPLVEGVQA